MMEYRLSLLLHALRCLDCQGQTLATSRAPMAQAMKAWIQEKIARGESDATILESLVSIYGPEIMLAPPFDTKWMLFWFVPFFLVALGFLFLPLVLKKI